MHRYGLSALAALTLGLAACGGDDDSGTGGPGSNPVVACNMAAASLCIELFGPVNVAGEQAACTTGGGALVAACPTANVLGRCTASHGGGATSATIFYSGTTWTSTTAQAACAAFPGTWGP